MSKGNVLLGTLVGIAIGGITGILFAPEKGSTTRKQIKDRSDDYLVELQSRLNGLSDSITGKYENAKHTVGNLAAQGQAKYQDVKQDAKSAASNSGHSTL